MIDACKYVDVFYGNGETDRFFDDGLASKWFYVKAICGNTVPHAVLPFGRMSVGPFSGGYSSGYGTHFPNGCGGIRKLSDRQTVRGFSHLHQSGVGGMKFYYNYVIASPIYGGAEKMLEFRELQGEEARPGYYKCELDGIKCELTVDGGVAVHRYTFEREGGRVAVDLSNNGLSRSFSEGFRGTVENETVELIADNDMLGDIRQKIGKTDHARDAYLRALDTRIALAKDNPGDVKLQEAIADRCAAIAAMDPSHDKSRELLEMAVAVWERLFAQTGLSRYDENAQRVQAKIAPKRIFAERISLKKR